MIRKFCNSTHDVIMILGLDNCASVTCQNNGNCTDLLDSFKCECPSGYLGYLCDLSTNLCHACIFSFLQLARKIAVSPAWSKLARLRLKLANCDRGPGTEEIFS